MAVLIPDGWESLPIGTVLKDGDRFLHDRSSKELADWRIVPKWELGESIRNESANVIRKKKDILAVPEGWERVPVGGKIQSGDKYTWNRLGTENLSAWIMIGRSSTGQAIDSNMAPIIRKKQEHCGNVVAVAPIQNPCSEIEQKKEKPMINRQNLIALLALVGNQKTDAEDVLPGTSGDGVFAQALRDAEKERREEAVKALTGIAKEIQDTLGREKANLRASIKSVRETERGLLTRLNELDAAAALLSGETPNPFPLMSRLGLVHRGDLALSTAEFEALVAVPKA